MRLIAWLAVLLLALSAKPVAIGCVALSVRPRVMIQRGDILVQVRIAKHADHRGLRFSWASDTGTEGSSSHDLQGAATPPLWSIRLPEQPVAQYAFVVDILDSAGQVVASDRAVVQAPDGHE